MTDILTLSQVHKWAGTGTQRTEILRGVSLAVREGEFVSIMGPSGSGKSTLLNIMGLLDGPSSGTVCIAGRDVSRVDESELARQRARSIGFIFQSFNLLSYLNVRQNIELPLLYTRYPHPSRRSQDLLAQVKLEQRAKAYPVTLSGGERQRVAIARALANQPALLLADEPTGSLDSQTGGQIMELIDQLHRSGSTVVLVTHDEKVARRGQRILVMKDGRFE